MLNMLLQWMISLILALSIAYILDRIIGHFDKQDEIKKQDNFEIIKEKELLEKKIKTSSLSQKHFKL